MEIRSANLETVCGVTSTLPVHTLPEIALAGKSNVGKSSLVNALLCRKALARVSEKPGKTVTINYYRINDDCYFVDLPGYGYAKAAAKEREEWGKLIEKYLHTSAALKLVLLLVDIRRTPSENDLLMMRWILAQGFSPVVVLTKLDKLSAKETRKQMAVLSAAFPKETRFFPTSVLTKKGIRELGDFIESQIGAI